MTAHTDTAQLLAFPAKDGSVLRLNPAIMQARWTDGYSLLPSVSAGTSCQRSLHP